MLLDLRSLAEDFPVTSSFALSAFWAAPYSGAPWAEHDSVTGAVAGSSGGQSLTKDAVIAAPTKGATVNGRQVADFSSVEGVLGSSLIEWFSQQYDPVAATWTGEKHGRTFGPGGNPTQPTAGTTPGGYSVLHFDGIVGAGAMLTAAAAIVLPGEVGTAGGPGEYLWACIFKTEGSPDRGTQVFLRTDFGIYGVDTLGRLDGHFNLASANSDESVMVSGWHRVIGIGNETPLNVMYVDGALQTEVADVDVSMRSSFLTPVGIGISGSFEDVLGSIGAMIFAYTPTTFSASTIAALDAVLAGFITG